MDFFHFLLFEAALFLLTFFVSPGLPFCYISFKVKEQIKKLF